MSMKALIDTYFELEEEVHKAFGYKEDWRAIPLDDKRDFLWCLDAYYDANGMVRSGEVCYAETLEDLNDRENGECYSNEIYTQRFLPKYVYRTDEYTMISVDTHTDGNKFLQIFDNLKEVKL